MQSGCNVIGVIGEYSGQGQPGVNKTVNCLRDCLTSDKLSKKERDIKF